MVIVYAGIDPGIGGGIAWIAAKTAGTVVDYGCCRMPSTERDLWDILGDVRSMSLSCQAIIERIPTAIYGVGKGSMSKLFGNYAACRMGLIGVGIPFEDVNATGWHHVLKIPARKKTETGTAWKNRLKAKAQQLFPKAKVTLATADALLIAEYCRRINLASSEVAFGKIKTRKRR